ncbi:MAG: hypothetical protein ACYCZP_13555 [Acidimicrobiales bacterium]
MGVNLTMGSAEVAARRTFRHYHTPFSPTTTILARALRDVKLLRRLPRKIDVQTR